jgi:peptidylprolyl isomerase
MLQEQVRKRDMTQVTDGDTVQVHYTSRLHSGQVFDTTENRKPMEFTVGQGKVIRGVEKAVLGMAPGESKSVLIPAEEAFGPRREDLVLVLNRDQIPAGTDLQAGQQVEIRLAGGGSSSFRVVRVSDREVLLDANHELAGEDVRVDLDLVDIAQ